MDGIKTSKVPQVQSAILEQRRTYELLKEAIYALLDKLNYVSREDSESNKTEPCEIPQALSLLVPLAVEISRNTDLLHSLKFVVDEAITKLEI